MIRRMPSASDLSYFDGEPDPIWSHGRMRARAALWDELHRAGIDVENFDRWLAARLRKFYGSRHVEAQIPAPAEELEWLRQCRALVAQIAPLVRYGAAPVRAHDKVSLAALRCNIDLHALRDRLQLDLATFDALLAGAASALRAAPVRRGRKADVARDELLRDVMKELQAAGIKKKAVIGPLALKTLQAEGIATPAAAQELPEKAAARVARRVRK